MRDGGWPREGVSQALCPGSPAAQGKPPREATCRDARSGRGPAAPAAANTSLCQGRGALHICKASSKHHLYQQAEAPLLCAQSSATCPFTANLDIHYQPEGAQRLLVRRPTEGRPRVHIGRSRLGRHLGLPRPWTSRLRHRPLLVEGRAGGEQRARPQ